MKQTKRNRIYNNFPFCAAHQRRVAIVFFNHLFVGFFYFSLALANNVCVFNVRAHNRNYNNNSSEFFRRNNNNNTTEVSIFVDEFALLRLVTLRYCLFVSTLTLLRTTLLTRSLPSIHFQIYRVVVIRD